MSDINQRSGKTTEIYTTTTALVKEFWNKKIKNPQVTEEYWTAFQQKEEHVTQEWKDAVDALEAKRRELLALRERTPTTPLPFVLRIRFLDKAGMPIVEETEGVLTIISTAKIAKKLEFHGIPPNPADMHFETPPLPYLAYNGGQIRLQMQGWKIIAYDEPNIGAMPVPRKDVTPTNELTLPLKFESLGMQKGGHIYQFYLDKEGRSPVPAPAEGKTTEEDTKEIEEETEESEDDATHIAEAMEEGHLGAGTSIKWTEPHTTDAFIAYTKVVERIKNHLQRRLEQGSNDPAIVHAFDQLNKHYYPQLTAEFFDKTPKTDQHYHDALVAVVEIEKILKTLVREKDKDKMRPHYKKFRDAMLKVDPELKTVLDAQDAQSATMRPTQSSNSEILLPEDDEKQKHLSGWFYDDKKIIDNMVDKRNADKMTNKIEEPPIEEKKEYRLTMMRASLVQELFWKKKVDLHIFKEEKKQELGSHFNEGEYESVVQQVLALLR